MKKVDNTFRTCAILRNVLLQYDGLGTIGEFDVGYKLITDKYNTDVQDVNTGELPCGEWLDRDIEVSDFRLISLVRRSNFGYAKVSHQSRRPQIC
jgi:hypothetical protein